MSKFFTEDPAGILGAEVEDAITGFRGTAITKLTYITGCVQYFVKPRVDEKGANVEGCYIDELQCRVIAPGVREDTPSEATQCSEVRENSKPKGGCSLPMPYEAPHQF